MFGIELALIEYLHAREMSRRRRAQAERDEALRSCDQSGVRLRPQAPANVSETTRFKRGLFG